MVLSPLKYREWHGRRESLHISWTEVLPERNFMGVCVCICVFVCLPKLTRIEVTLVIIIIWDQKYCSVGNP